MTIFLYGIIGENIFLKDIIDTYNKNIKDDTIKIRIHSPGGDVIEGFAIYDFLKSTGKRIETVVEGLCASMATVILLVGDKREMSEHSTFMIHLPSIELSPLKNYTAADLDVISRRLKDKERDVTGVYKSATKISDVDLYAYMKDETFMTADKAFELGFITEKPISEIKAVAFLNEKFNIKNKNKMEKELTGLSKTLDKIWNFISKEDVKDEVKNENIKNILKITTDTGEEIDVNTSENTYKVDDEIDVADGEYVIPSTKEIIVVANKKIVEIKPMDEIIEENAVELLEKENEELKARIDELEIKMIKYNEMFDQVSLKIDKINKSITSKFSPVMRTTTFNSNANMSNVTKDSEQLREIKESNMKIPIIKNFKIKD